MAARIGTLTIASGATTSNSLSRRRLAHVGPLVIVAPAALTGVVTIQVPDKENSPNWVALQSGGADVTLPAGKATTLDISPFLNLRLSSTLAEGAQRDFEVFGE